MSTPTSSQWRSAANVLREFAAEWDAKAEREICGVVSASGPNGEPLACGYPAGCTGPHSWASLGSSRVGSP